MSTTVAQASFYTVPQVAKLLAVNGRKVGDWIHRGELVAINAAVNPTGERPRWRIAAADLQAFLEARQSKPVETLVVKRARRRSGERPKYLRG